MIHQELEILLKPVVEDLGCELWACEYIPQGKHSLLRIYIDKPVGILIDDCERVSREVSVFLDIESPITKALKNYTLEVSSPGLERPLLKEEHFQRFLGSQVMIKTRNPIDKRRKLEGKLIEVREGIIHVLVSTSDNKASEVPIVDIIKANVVFNEG